MSIVTVRVINYEELNKAGKKIKSDRLGIYLKEDVHKKNQYLK
jgi:hypothetical protein